MPDDGVPFDDVRCPNRGCYASNQAVYVGRIDSLRPGVAISAELVLNQARTSEVPQVRYGRHDGEHEWFVVRGWEMSELGQCVQEIGTNYQEKLGAPESECVGIDINSGAIPTPVRPSRVVLKLIC